MTTIYTGKRLKLKRVKLDIKAMDIAEMLGVSKSYVSLMEKGDRPIPSEIYSKWIQILN